MIIEISGNYDLEVNPLWKNVQLEKVYLHCDTSTGPVTINLFAISELQRFFNVELFVVDISNTASFNNITINSDFIDSINSFAANSIVIDTNGGGCELQVLSESKWSATQSVSPIPTPTGVNYSNVFFVDPVYGNNATALSGRFDKPYLTIASALSAANATAPNSTNRALVWIRKGQYVNVNAVIPYNNCDVYCDAGVVFIGSFQCWDTYLGSATNFNWYGYAKWSLNMSIYPFRWQYASNVFIQGDSLLNSGAISIAFNVTVGTSDITYDFNSMESTRTLGNGFAFSWRNNCNGTVNVKKYIKSPHAQQTIVANHSGNITINCPRNVLTATNIYGGNFKQIIYSSSSQVTSKIVINGDLFDENIGYWGGISAMLLIQGGSCEIIHNGNIQCNTVAMWNGGAGRIISNGDIASTVSIGVNNGSGTTFCKNATLTVNQTGGAIRIFYVSGTAQSWFVNTPMYLGVIDGNLIQQDSNTSKIFMLNVQAQGEGLLGALVNAAVVGTVNQFTGVVANKTTVNVVNELAQGLIIDSLIQTPKF